MSKEEALSKLESIAKNNAVAIKLSIAVLTCMNVIVCGLIYNTLTNTNNVEVRAGTHMQPNGQVVVNTYIPVEDLRNIQEEVIMDADENAAQMYLSDATSIDRKYIEGSGLEEAAIKYFGEDGIKGVYANAHNYLVMSSKGECMYQVDGNLYIDGTYTGESVSGITGLGTEKYNEQYTENVKDRLVKIEGQTEDISK